MNKVNNDTKNEPQSFKEAFEKAVVQAGYTSVKQYKQNLVEQQQQQRKE